MGWVANDHQGTAVFQGSSQRSYVVSVLVAETLALKSGLQQAALLGYKDAVCLTDYRCLVDLLTGKIPPVFALKGLLHNICVLSKSFTSINFRYISRSCNSAADSRAKNALFVLTNI